MIKLKDIYVEKLIERIKDLIQMEKYGQAGLKFYDLTNYGIVTENRLLILLSSELADVFSTSIIRYKRYEKDLDKNKLNVVISSTNDLLEFLTIDEKDLKLEDKQEIFDLLLSTISNSESIQKSIKELSDLIYAKGRYRGEVV